MRLPDGNDEIVPNDALEFIDCICRTQQLCVDPVGAARVCFRLTGAFAGRINIVEPCALLLVFFVLLDPQRFVGARALSLELTLVR